jgi:hypothetical protein
VALSRLWQAACPSPSDPFPLPLLAPNRLPRERVHVHCRPCSSCPGGKEVAPRLWCCVRALGQDGTCLSLLLSGSPRRDVRTLFMLLQYASLPVPVSGGKEERQRVASTSRRSACGCGPPGPCDTSDESLQLQLQRTCRHGGRGEERVSDARGASVAVPGDPTHIPTANLRPKLPSTSGCTTPSTPTRRPLKTMSAAPSCPKKAGSKPQHHGIRPTLPHSVPSCPALPLPNLAMAANCRRGPLRPARARGCEAPGTRDAEQMPAGPRQGRGMPAPHLQHPHDQIQEALHILKARGFPGLHGCQAAAIGGAGLRAGVQQHHIADFKDLTPCTTTTTCT